MRTITTGENPTLVALATTADASAEVTVTGSETRVQFRIAAGHMPAQVRAELVDAVFGLPQLGHHQRLHAAVPIGDAQLIDLVRRRCVSVEMRAAGSTCLIDAETV